MKRNILYIAFASAVLAAAALTSCNENELEPKKAGEGKKISFSISDAGTRTEYDSDDNLQINWTEGDKVRIFCDEAEDVKKADYTVAQISKNSGKLVYNESGLAWGGDDLVHNFYAVYPADKKIIAGVDGGKVTVNANLNQMCTVVGTEPDENKMYNTTPDMTNAIMVAKLSTKPVDNVELSFKPIMTTLEVVVRGKTADIDTENIGTEITGISINMDASAYGATSKQFIYDINADDIVRGDLNSTVQFFVGIKNSDGSNSLHLNTNESVKLTAFLPPVAVDKNHKIQIRVHATGSTELVATIGGTMKDDSVIEIVQSSKRKITLPWIKSVNLSNNNWITPLDGNIYISQMSIPGSHDAATGETMATIIGDFAAATQELTLDKQWNLGARAFDLRPAIYKSANELWLYHGATRVSVSWATAMNTIKAQLTSNPGEFAIVLFRHENEATLGKNNNDSDFNTYMTNYINQNKDWIVDWKPDLTINEARGKIILISRFQGDWSYGCFTGWGHGQDGVTTTLKNADGTKTATMYVQDYYNPSSSSAKWESIKKYLDIARTFYKDADKTNCWMINHCSGYTGATSSYSYRDNAAYQNPKLIDYITSSDWEGGTGIVLFDYTGSNKTGSVFTATVKGDIALQTIIDNNFKYHMKRKDE